MGKLAKFIRPLFMLCLFGMLLFCVGMLPSMLVSAGDKLLIDEIHLEDAEDALTLPEEELDVIGKLALLEGTAASDTSFYYVAAGNRLDSASAFDTAGQELGKLIELGILPQGEFRLYDGFDFAGIYFVMRLDAPGNNMILWEQRFILGDISGVLYIDDETGLILQFYAVSETGRAIYETGGVIMDTDFKDWIAAWAEYLGISYIESQAEYDDGPYYTALFEANGAYAKVSTFFAGDTFMFGGSSNLGFRGEYTTKILQ